MSQEQTNEIIKKDDLESFKKLLTTGLNPSDFLDSSERNCLHQAARFNSTKILGYILENSLVPIESKDKFLATPFIVSAIKGSNESLKLLQEYGANINAQQEAGKTAIMLALQSENLSTVKMLQNFNVDLTIKDRLNRTILDLEKEMSEQARNELSELNEVEDKNSNVPHVEVTKDDKEKYANFTEEEIKSLKELKALGFEDINEEIKRTGSPIGREEEVEEIVKLINKTNNVLVVGETGIGKTTMMRQIAQSLESENKILLQVPTSLLRGNRYANSINENISKWLKTACSLYPKVILFIDETHNLTAGKTSEGSSDTPTQILKEFLDNIGDERIQVLGATTSKEYDLLKDADEAFVNKFVNGGNGGFELKDMSKEKVLSVLKHPATIRILKEDGLEINNEEKYFNLIDKSVNLLDKYIFNQKFPYKAFDFLKTILSSKKLEEIDDDILEKAFSKKYSIPVEIIRGEINEDSKFFKIKTTCKNRMLGQDENIDIISQRIIGNTVFKNPEDRKPISFLFLGPTGVGKSETTEVLAELLNYPKYEFKMGEYKTVNDMNKLVESLTEFIKKNYSGIIVFDELEKAHPQILDVLLGLLDKGRLGSGKEEVRCGNQIFIATTNIGVDATFALKKESKEMYGTTGLPEDYLRELLIQAGIRPEIVNRIGTVLDYNPIFMDVAIQISRNIFNKRKQEIYNNHGVEIIFEDSFVVKQIEDNFDDDNNKKNGARGIQRIVEKSFNKLVENDEILLRKKPGTKMIVSENEEAKEIHVKIISEGNEPVEVIIKDEKLSREEKFKNVLASFQRLKKETDHALGSSVENKVKNKGK